MRRIEECWDDAEMMSSSEGILRKLSSNLYFKNIREKIQKIHRFSYFMVENGDVRNYDLKLHLKTIIKEGDS